MSNEETINVFVKTMTGNILTLQTKPSSTVGDVKAQVEGLADIPTGEQRLVFAGQLLENDQTLSDANILNESTLTMMTSIRS